MCSIMGWTGRGADLLRFSEGLKKTASRGPDDTRITDTGKGLIGFNRLSIMGLTPEGMQPFELDGDIAVCNGELYGFEKTRAELMEKDIPLRAGATVRSYFPYIRNTEQRCSVCWTRSSP